MSHKWEKRQKLTCWLGEARLIGSRVNTMNKDEGMYKLMNKIKQPDVMSTFPIFTILSDNKDEEIEMKK